MISRRALAIFGMLMVLNGNIHSTQQHELPPDCLTGDFTQTGRPIMFAPRNGLAMGIYAPHEVFVTGDPISIHVWVNNRTDREQVLSSCSLWYEWSVDVYNSKWSRITPRREMQQKSSDALTRPPRVCFRDVPLPIPSHYCGLLRDVSDVTIDLHKEYDLPPGSYVVTGKAQNPQQSGLPIVITIDKSRYHS